MTATISIFTYGRGSLVGRDCARCPEKAAYVIQTDDGETTTYCEQHGPSTRATAPTSDESLREPTRYEDCGTPAAAQRHHRSGERPDDACREAQRIYAAEWRRRTHRTTSTLLTDMEIAHLSGKCGDFL